MGVGAAHHSQAEPIRDRAIFRLSYAVKSMLKRASVLTLVLLMAAASMAQAEIEAALLQHTNAQRQMQGLPAVQPDEALARAARRHAAEMAELGYLAHQSPRPENRILPLRLNQAGALVQAMAENLAMLSRVPDIAAAAVSGWMDSPGHRRNLLGDFTHAGFGVATSSSGATYVVQVLGLQTVAVNSITALRSQQQVYVLDIAYTLSAPREVAFWVGEDVTVPGMTAPGSQSLAVEMDEPRLVHVSSGVRQAGQSDDGVFIAADSGWFDPGTGAWTPADAESGSLKIESVRGSWVAREVVQVTLDLAAPLPGAHGVWLGDDWLEDVTIAGTAMHIRVPATAGSSMIRIGVEDIPGSGTYSVVISLELVPGPGGMPEVRPVNPGS